MSVFHLFILLFLKAVQTGKCDVRYFPNILDDMVERWSFIVSHLASTGQDKAYRFIIEEVVLL